MATLILFAVVMGCAALVYLKATLARGLIMILNAVVGGFFALGYFEFVGGLLAKYASALAPWSNTIAFLLLFVLVFAALQTIATQLNKEKIDMGPLPEKIGRVVCGVILGYVIAGQLLVAGAMAPLPNSYPYERFNARNPDPSQPNKVLLNPDGFVVGLFSTISEGGFGALREPKSFAMLHAGFLDALYLNRLMSGEGVPLRAKPSATSSAISVPRRGGVRKAPDSLRDSEGNPPSSRPGADLMLVTVEINRSALPEGGKFSLSQVRLVCRAGSPGTSGLTGQGHTVYPIGYVGPDGRLVQESLNTQITPPAGGRRQRDAGSGIDFAFHVPTQWTPTLIGFMNNSLEQLSLAPAEEPAQGDETEGPAEDDQER